MKAKKWCIAVLFTYLFIMIGIGVLVFVVDPYFHYHAPIRGLSHELNNTMYQNDGVIKNFDYNAMIIGTSTTFGFNAEEAGKLFGKEFVRITYLGEGFKRINLALQKAIAYNNELSFVIRGVDPIWFVTDTNYTGYSEYPDYLYDNVLWNDVNYIFNKDILINDVISVVCRTLSLKDDTSNKKNMTVIYTSDDNEGDALQRYTRPPKEEKIIEQSETDEFFRLLKQNMGENVFSTIEANPDITFYIFIPPYSICWWDSINQYGVSVLERRISMEKYVIEELLKYNNVRLFSFSNNYELTCNMNNYIDEIHYKEEVNSKILSWLQNGKYELTKDNYLNYLSDITEFYSNYNYDSLFE
ncbi:hypothetical protein [Kineothrix sp. MB12-C1]|uniref:hypothetical protein n=1 Tax=Kineothrix sp. MB12-C1 TaxID=3070215 RepID=UPI0027D1FCE2|nr:hypothetical protein [Kineothrix sp. MB12-C1]WMC92306.1 hypothetical protein RBB56_15880 [Kineothrix sp. MB12-C1]